MMVIDDLVNKYVRPPSPPKIVTIDIECSTTQFLIENYGCRFYPDRLNHKDITRPWVMFGAAWKYYGKPAQCISVSSKDPLNDYEVVRKLHEVILDAEILVGHNIDAFDLKKFNGRALYYDLPPIPKKLTIDTLKMARRYFSLDSNALSYLAKYLKLEAKDESPDWRLVLSGDPASLSYMREYNKKDVIVTEQVYDKLKVWSQNHPNLNVIQPVRDIDNCTIAACRVCQSTDLKRDGFLYTSQGKRPKYHCRTCRAYGTIKRGEAIA